MSRAMRCTITAPSGEELEATPRLEIGQTSGISFAPEDNLGVMTHGDMALDLDNFDGSVKAFLQGASPTTLFDVILERERGDGTGGWDRLFGGVFDIKSLSYENKKKTASITAWSYSKLLERTPANTIKRTLAPKTASINSGSRVMSFLVGANETSDVLAGDVVKLTNAQGNSGEFVIDSITDSEHALTAQSSSSTLTDCVAIVMTPFHRDKTPAQVAALIAAAVGMDLDGSDFAADLASFPIATPLVVVGGSSTAQPTSLVPHGTTLIASYDVADNAKRKVCAAPSTPWTDGATSNLHQFDWVPYLTAEPGTIYDRAVSSVPALSSDAQIQVPSFSSIHFVAECVAYTTGHDTTAGDRWQLVAPNDLATFTAVYLYKNGTFVIAIELIPTPLPGLQYNGTIHGWIEWDPFNNVPWFSYQYVERGSTEPTVRRLGIYLSTISAPTVRFIDSALSGQLRFSRGLGSDGMLLFYNCPISLANGPSGSGELRVLNINPLLTSFQAPPNATIAFSLGYPLLWTSRKWGTYLVFLFQQGDAVRIAMYDVSAIVTGVFTALVPFVAAYTVSDAIGSFRCYLTLFPLTDARTIVAGYAGGEWFVLSLRYDGVIRYADFEGRSCADAAAQLAIVTNSIGNVDAFRVLSLANRRGLGRGDVVRDLDVVHEETEMPISEVWRSNVKVSGKTNSGSAISIPIGDEGDSANQLAIDSALVTTPGMAIATGIATWQFVSAIRSQRNVTAPDDGVPLAFGQRVTRDGVPFVVYKGEGDIEQEIQHLTLLEVVQ